VGSNKFLDGVLWGMLIGGAAVFLFGTKKGKKLLDIITEEGAEGLNRVLEEIETKVEDIEDESLPDMRDNKEKVKAMIVEKFEQSLENHAHEKPKARRFFSSSKKSL
jgi:gas vesicle protein